MKLIKEKRWAIIFSLIAMFLWGSATPLIKLTYLHAEILPEDPGGKIFIAGIRFFMAGLLTFVYYFIFDKEKSYRKEINYKFIIILALIQTTLQYSMYYIGLSNTLGSLATIIQSSNAFMTVVISVILIKDEKFTTRKVMALIIGSIGMLVLNSRGSGGIHFKATGEGFVLLATFFNALGTVLIRKYGKQEDSFILIGWHFILGAIPLIIIGALTYKSTIIFDFVLFLMLCYGAFISATSFTIWTLVLQVHSASEFGIYKLFISIFGTILSVLFLGEELTIYIILGLIFVLLGAVVLNKK